MKLRYKILTAAVITAAVALIYRVVNGLDFQVYYAAGQSLLAGRFDMYSQEFAWGGVMDYRYPPFFLFIFLPFASLPNGPAQFLWYLCSVLVLFVAYFSIKKSFADLLETNSWLVPILAAVLSTKFVLMSLKLLNVHIFVLAFFFIAFCLLLRRKTAAAVSLMGLAISIKAFPILALPYFAIKKQWRFLTLTAAFTGVFILSPALFLGLPTTFQLHKEWFEHVVKSNEFYELNGPHNMSVQGLAERYFSEIDYERRTVDMAYQNINVANVDKGTISLIGKGLAATIFLLTFFVLWYASRRRTVVEIENPGTKFDSFAFHEFGMIICMILLIGPRTNHIYFLALFLPLVPFLHSLLKNRSIPMLLTLAVVITVMVILPLIPGARMQRLFLVLGTEFYATLALWTALGWLIIQNSLPMRSRATASLKPPV